MKQIDLKKHFIDLFRQHKKCETERTENQLFDLVQYQSVILRNGKMKRRMKL